MKIAGGGVENIIEFLRDLRELAINAATDTNTSEDRAILQKKADQILFSINDVATTTNYNSKNLIDGTFGKIYATAVTETVIETPAEILGDVTITGDGVYTIPENFSGTIILGEDAKNVEIKQASSAALENVQIVGSSSGGVNLWLDSLNISNSDDLSVIKMQGSGNTLTVKGTNNLAITAANAKSAVINVGGGTTIQGDDLTKNFYSGDVTSTLNVSNSGGTGAGIGSDENGSGGNINFGVGVNVTVDYTGTGAGIGSDEGGSIGDIQIGNRAGMVAVTNYSYEANDYDGGNGIGYGTNGTSGNTPDLV